MKRSVWAGFRRTAVLAVAGATVATGSYMALAATGKAAPGSGFGPVNITALSAAVRAPIYSNGGEEVAAELPYAQTTLSAGLSSNATTSVFWPGGTAANGGSTLYTATNGCPIPNGPCLPQNDFQALNDPMKAQAQSGAGKSVDDQSRDGITQHVVAKPTVVSAKTSVSASKVPAVSEAFGATSASTGIKVTGPKTAVVTALSSIKDVSLAGGVVKIATIRSTAQAMSNTVKGAGKATTTVAGATIAGVPVTIDSDGVHIKGQGSKVPSSAATAAVNKALKQAGLSIYVAKPTKTVKGPNVSVDAGNLIVLFQQSQYVAQGNDTGTLLVLGGATITANTGKGFTSPFVAPLSNPITPPQGQSGAAPPASGGGSTGGGSFGGGGGAGSVPSGPTTTSAGSSGQAPSVASSPSPSLAASSVHLLSGYGVLWAVLGAIVAVGLGAALRLLPDRVFKAPTVACPLED